MKRFSSVLSIVCIAAVCIVLFGAINTAAEELRVVTINIWSGLDYIGTLKMGEYETKQVREGRYTLLVEELTALDPDVIALNEANPLPGYARKLARDLNMDYVSAVGMGGIHIGCVGIPANFREGDAILAKKELNLRSLGKERLSGGGVITNFFTFHFSEANQVVGGVIEIAGETVYLLNTHIHAGPPHEQWFFDIVAEAVNDGRLSPEGMDEILAKIETDQVWRQEEVDLMLDWITETVPENAPVVLMGDFNAQIHAPEIQDIVNAGFIDTFGEINPDRPGYTWNPDENLNIITLYERETEGLTPVEAVDVMDNFVCRRIDFIFAGGSFEASDIASSEVVLNRSKNNQHPSDHFGLMSILHVK
ncbi:MAG: endonuclease/exonuclease/phosphatase family protein [Deltaproteobacteria bacterium]|nr:endonuclease/exonuclease/phosphatase family protein [Candidatus Zymogenaceae bacterium]